MMYLMLLVLIIVLCLVFKISSRYLFILAGLLIVFHPLLLAKGQITAVYQVSIVAFLLFLSALIIDAIAHITYYSIDEQDSFVINLIKQNIKIGITSVKASDNVDTPKVREVIAAKLKELRGAGDTVVFTRDDILKVVNNIFRLITKSIMTLASISLLVGHYIIKKYLSIALALICILLFWKVGFTAAGLSLVFFAFVANKWDSRIIAGLALIFLSMSPLLLIFKNESLAETFAVYTFDFLVLFVILQIVEYNRDNKFTGDEISNSKL